MCFSFGLCALMLRIVRLVPRGRDVVTDFAISSSSAFLFEIGVKDLIHVPFFRNGAVLPSPFGVAKVDTFCGGLLIRIFDLPVLLLCSTLTVQIPS